MGLNDGFIIDDTTETPQPQIKVNALKDTNAGEDPVMKDDVDLIGVLEQDAEQKDDVVALENAIIRLTDLNFIHQNLIRTNGISQQIALESAAIVPELIGDVRPMGSYTKMVSKVNHAAALETVTINIRDVAKKSYELLVKIIGRIREFFEKFFGDKKETEERIKDAAEQAKLAGAADQLKITAKDPESKGKTLSQKELETLTTSYARAAFNKGNMSVLVMTGHRKSISDFTKVVTAGKKLLANTTLSKEATLSAIEEAEVAMTEFEQKVASTIANYDEDTAAVAKDLLEGQITHCDPLMTTLLLEFAGISFGLDRALQDVLAQVKGNDALSKDAIAFSKVVSRFITMTSRAVDAKERYGRFHNTFGAEAANEEFADIDALTAAIESFSNEFELTDNIALEEDQNAEEKKKGVIDLIKSMIAKMAEFFKKLFGKDKVAQLKTSVEVIKNGAKSGSDAAKLIAGGSTLALPAPDYSERDAKELEQRTKEKFKTTIGSISDVNLRMIFAISTNKFGASYTNFTNGYIDILKNLDRFKSEIPAQTEKIKRVKAMVDVIRKEAQTPLKDREALLDELLDNVTFSKRTMFQGDVISNVLAIAQASHQVEKFIEANKGLTSSVSTEETAGIQHALIALNAFIFEAGRMAEVTNKFAKMIVSYQEELIKGKTATPANESTDLPELERVPSEDLVSLDESISSAGEIEVLEEALDNYMDGLDVSNEALDIISLGMMPSDSLKLATNIANHKVDKSVFTAAIAEKTKMNLDYVKANGPAFLKRSAEVRARLEEIKKSGFLFGSKPTKRRDVTPNDIDRVKAFLNAETAGIMAAAGLPAVFAHATKAVTLMGTVTKTDMFVPNAFWTAVVNADKPRTAFFRGIDIEFVEDHTTASRIIAEGALGVTVMYEKRESVYEQAASLIDVMEFAIEKNIRRYMSYAEEKGYDKDLAYFTDVLKVYESFLSAVGFISSCIYNFLRVEKNILA